MRSLSNPDMHYKDIILLILDKIEIFCYEDRKALLDYQNDKSLPNEILENLSKVSMSSAQKYLSNRSLHCR
jgi:hypothetical protein